jgi:putative transposase
VTDFRKFTVRQLADFCARHMPAGFQNVLLERAGSDRERRLWQPTRHPVQIETEPFWQAKIDYLHQNPVRKGLVREAEHWRFSSASYWASGGKTDNDVLLSAIVW